MDIIPLLHKLEATAPAAAIRDSLILFPLFESIHVIGLALVFGTIIIVDLRILGVASKHRVYHRMAEELLKWTWAAFALTALTGVFMFITNPVTYFENIFFRVKMLLLLLAGVNMMIFHLTANRTMASWEDVRPSPAPAKIAAALSLCIWVAVIAMGRMIGFSITGAAKAPEPPPPDVNFDDFLSSIAPDGPASAPPVQVISGQA